MKPTDAAANDQTPAPKPPMTYRECNPTSWDASNWPCIRVFRPLEKASGPSMGQILRAPLDPAVRDRQADYDKGHSDGYRRGMIDFAVTYPCCRCGRTLLVTSEAERAEVAEVMPMRRWGCKRCPPPPPIV